ncbi:hypothetical protein COY29_04610 [Candidatus Woesebacteria bacterium CG_4_10_14_0_2_um_filter_39_14]|uniref:RDD domain-containing protein n=1 Tax=Candidatus Woesebacteria bacterium CG_4_10_14_0_2_um_filter_39_14 TaxID=1975054 RepID=A0A2M7TLD2_9BACT|nr:MAG: hypothetical protein COY29_04610 [Candidatus Woesebacteria bacterium CG_4_10_14_0_2_um_filter_39_14]
MENQVNTDNQNSQQVGQNTTSQTYNQISQIPAASVSLESQSLATSAMEIKPGGAWARFWAAVVDSLVLGVLFIPIVIVFELLSSGQISFSPEVRSNLENNTTLGIIAILLILAYYIGFTAQRGATPAKKLYKLKVVKYKNKEKVSYRQAIIREVLKLILFSIPILGALFYLINGLFIVFSKQKRGIHDLIAGTQVIREVNIG